MGAARGLRGHPHRQSHRQFDHDGGIAAQIDADVALQRGRRSHHRQPGRHPPTGPNCSAAEMVAFVAHSVVGHDWLSAIQWSEATNSVDSMRAKTTTTSAITHDGRRPKPSQVGDRARDAPGDQYGAQHTGEHRTRQVVVDRDLEPQRVQTAQQPKDLRGTPQWRDRVERRCIGPA